MYRYNDVDKQIVHARVAEFRDQVRRRLADELKEEDFLPLRLQNGLYHQRHAYMLRVGVPYGLLSSAQIRTFAMIAEKYDRGFGHFTTRQNIQFNWMELADVPDILAHLADVEMHAMQTSGNCVRNITCDPLAGVAPDELVDPRPLAEMLRQYKEIHPEFLFLPRKFKFAITGATKDRAAIAFHDIGFQAVERDGELGWRILVGGGIGRTPRIGQEIQAFVETEKVIGYVEAMLRVYNLQGRRDNKYKARIKILVGDMGVDAFREAVDAEWPHVECKQLDMERYRAIQAMFAGVPPEAASPAAEEALRVRAAEDATFAHWIRANVKEHRSPGHRVIFLSLKAPGEPPGDATDQQLYAIADLMDRYNQGCCVATYNQNLLFQDVRAQDVLSLYDALQPLQLTTPNIDSIADQICCPGLDFCNLASTASIPLAKDISERFSDPDELEDLGTLHVNMSGCVNACGHHHTGHIGILGVERAGAEAYQIKVGGHPGTDAAMPAAIGEIVGPSVTAEEVIPLIERLLDCYKRERTEGETFVETCRRIGVEPFKEAARE
jgi:sulfite reductase (NADPH) hemoprotein beta-component